jgi:hypothetical protein
MEVSVVDSVVEVGKLVVGNTDVVVGMEVVEVAGL